MEHKGEPIDLSAIKKWTCPAFVESVFKFTRPVSRTEAG
jgi:hypothetical protein